MQHLNMKGQEVHSLAELRENFDQTQLTAAFLDKSLEKWLAERYYEQAATAVQQLEHTLSPAVEKKLCQVLGIALTETELSQEKREVYERKLSVLRQHTQDEEVLSHALETATNQSELAELLEEGATTIYLCSGPFTVPIQKGGIHYIGIDRPKLEVPFTEEQYRRAEITFQGIDLPPEGKKDMVPAAERAAAKRGYDDFSEKHNYLATMFHLGMKGPQVTRFMHLQHSGSSVAGKLYKSKGEAKRASQQVINKAYDEAGNYFSPGHGTCVARSVAEQYGKRISGVQMIVEGLSPLCGRTPIMRQRLAALEEKVKNAERNLRKLFEDELIDSSNYYRMYERSYFLERVDIEELDYNPDPYDSDFLNALSRLVFNETEYIVSDLLETLTILEEDVRDRADTFFQDAFCQYRNYCGEIEELAQSIGQELSEDDLMKLGLVQRNGPTAQAEPVQVSTAQE